MRESSHRMVVPALRKRKPKSSFCALNPKLRPMDFSRLGYFGFHKVRQGVKAGLFRALERLELH